MIIVFPLLSGCGEILHVGYKLYENPPRWESTKRTLVQEPNYEKCLDLVFAASPCEKVIIVPNKNFITSAIIKFMLDLPSPGTSKV